MDGSRTIRVIKRDGCEEVFDPAKLAAAIYRAMLRTRGDFRDAAQLALAIGVHLSRSGAECAASATLLRMVLRVLRRTCFAPTAECMETYYLRRRRRRAEIRVRHACGRYTLCDKGWLSELACRNWNVSRRAGRIIAAEVERDLLAGERDELTRHEIQDMINQRVAEFGLADAVPVELRTQPT